MRSSWAFLGCASLLACQTGLEIGATTISCRADDECPQGTACDVNTGLCVGPDPRLELGSVERSVGDVAIPITTVSSVDREVTLAGTFESGVRSGPMTLRTSRAPASADGESATVVWDATRDLGEAGLSERVRVSLIPFGSQGPGAAATSARFAYGNDAPILLDATAPPRAGGFVELTLRATDTGGDRVALTGLTLTELTTEATTEIPVDAQFFPDVEGLEWTADGLEQAIVWDARATPAGTYRVDVTVADPFGASASASIPAVEIDNAPLLTVDVPPPGDDRYVDSLPVELSIADPAGAAATVSARVEFSVDGAEWLPARAAPEGDTLTELDGAGTTPVFVWDTLAEANGSDGLALSPSGRVAYTPAVFLRVIATNDRGATRIVPLDSTLAVGNDAPSLNSELPASLLAAAVPISYRVRDSAADPVDIETEFALSDGIFRRAALGAGTDRDLPSDPEAPGRAGVFVWDSTAPPNGAPSTPQGVGAQRVRVDLRIRACDEVGGARDCGSWFTLPPVELLNQTAPVIQNLQLIGALQQEGSGPFGVSFDIFDAQGDLADIRAEMSLDLGQSFVPLPEFPAVYSSGTTDLVPGRTQVLFLDPSGLSFGPSELAVLRIRVTDGFPTDAPDETEARLNLASPLRVVGPRDFTPYVSVATVSNEMTVALFGAEADFNEDGYTDVIGYGLGGSSGCGGPEGQARLYLAQDTGAAPSGDFTSSAFAAPGAPPRGLIAADLDNDGHTDIAVSRDGFSCFPFDPAAVLIYWGDGTGGFMTGPSIDVDGDALLQAELNGDNRPDLILARRNGAALILSSPAATDRTNLYSGPVTTTFSSITIDVLRTGDVNGDGAADLVYIATAFGALGVALGNGDGTFEEAFAEDLPVPPSELVVGDVDGDGRDDVVLLSDTTRAVEAFRWSTEGALESQGVFDTGRELNIAGLVDASGDGVLDLLLVRDGELALMGGAKSGAGDLVFLAPVFSPGVSQPGPFLISQFAGDAAPDLFTFHGPSFGSLTVLEGRRTVSFAAASFPRSDRYPTEFQAEDIQLFDLDRDGALDPVVGHPSRNSIGFLLSQSVEGAPTGSFGAEIEDERFNNAFAVTVHDLNRDGFADLFSRDFASYKVILGANPSGIGGYPRVPSVEALTPPNGLNAATRIRAADVTGDGWPDVVITAIEGSGGGRGRFYYPNTGTGVSPLFGPARLLPDAAGDSPADFELADLDGDADLDIVVLNRTSTGTALSVLSNDGIGNFTELPPVSASNELTAFSAALELCDVNGDGVLDAVSARHDSGTLNLGQSPGGVPNGSFANGIAVTLSSSTSTDVECADIDHDGFADMIFAFSLTNGRAEVYRGGLHDFFSRVVSPLPLGDAPSALAVADLSGDGLLDLAASGINQIQIARQDDIAGFERRLTTLSTSGGLAGAAPLFAGTDRFGRTRVPRLLIRPAAFDRQDTRVDDEACGLSAENWVPLTDTFEATGDVRLRRVFDSGGRARTAVGSRLDLDLGPTELTEQRGVVLQLPLLAASAGLVDTPETSVRVVIESPDWVRASELPFSDPLPAPEARLYLGSYEDGVGRVQTFFLPKPRRSSACAAPDGDLSQGNGARFVIDGDTLLLFTERLGVIRAFVAAP